MILLLLGAVLFFVCFVLSILIGVKINKKEGGGIGILAIVLAVLCQLPVIIWGLVKRKEYGISNGLLFGALGSLVIGGILYGVGSAKMATEMQKALEEGAMEFQQGIEEAVEEAASQPAQ